jgi:hypothetical protein
VIRDIEATGFVRINRNHEFIAFGGYCHNVIAAISVHIVIGYGFDDGGICQTGMADGNQECQEKQAAEQRKGVTYDHFGEFRNE